MRIERFHIDGFGDIFDRDIGPLDRPLTIIYGPNEAGKSTLLSFIRHVLFGFPSGNSRENRYMIDGAGWHGGSLHIKTDADERYAITRQRGEVAAGTVTILSDGGNTLDAVELPRLLGNASRSLFESIFAFDLDELAAFKIADDAEIASRLYGASTGASRLPSVLRHTEQSRDGIFVSRGRSQPIPKILGELDSVQGSLRAVQDQASIFRQLNDEFASTIESIQLLDTDLDGKAQRRNEIGRLVSVWDPWIELRDTRRQLDELPRFEDFPEEPISRLENLEERLQGQREIVADAKKKLNQAQEEVSSSIPDSELLGSIAGVNTIRERRGAFVDSLRDLPERRAEAKTGESALRDELRALGTDWSPEKVTNFDISITRTDEINQWQSNLAQHQLEKRDSEQKTDGISTELLEVEQRLDALKSRDSHSSKTENQSPQRTIRRLLPTLALLSIGVVVAAIGLIVPEPLVVGVGLGSVVTAVWVFIQRFTSTTNVREQIPITDSAVLAEVKHTVTRLRTRSLGAIEELRVANNRAQIADEEWVEWLLSSHLPASLTPEGASRLLSQIEIVSRRIVDVRERVDRADAIQNDIDEYRSFVTPLADAIELGNAEDDHSVLGISDEIVSRYENARDLSQKRISDEARVLECENDKVQALRVLGDIAGIHSDLLNAGGTDDAEEFRRRAAEHSKGSALRSTEQELISTLHRLIGPNADLANLDQKLADTSLEAINSELSDTVSDLSELNEQRDTLQNRQGELTNEIAKMQGDEVASRLRTKRALLHDRLITEADEWSRYSIAKALLERTRQKYERERQPAVLEKASSYFSSLTEGRYERVYQPIGSRDFQVIDTGDGGAHKIPDKLSRGTKEQLYLSMRFAAVDEFGERQERLPVIVDEVLVNFDPVRARKAAEKFSELSRRNQVLVFTCHPWVRDIFSEVNPDVEIITLAERD